MSAALVGLALLAFSPNFVIPYNIDTSQPIIYKDPESDGSNYFGFSVSLSLGKKGASSPSLFVGAPQYSNGTGRVYRCTESSTNGTKTLQCQALVVEDSSGWKSGWLGASMASTATERSLDFTVCAPRTLIPNRNVSKTPANQLMGTCYYIGNLKDVLYPNKVNYEPIIKNTTITHGWSVSYVKNNNSPSSYCIIGRPGSEYLDIKNVMQKPPRSFFTQEFVTTYGYSVTSGHFSGQRGSEYVAGEPSYSNRGRIVSFRVSILNRPSVLDGKYINGSVLGEYFGASLASGDFDGDGRDDLAVGAPHWGDGDFGRVYIYHKRFYGDFQKGQTLQGKVNKGQFGYTLASADLDRDGCSDLIISAPWENEGLGAIYVYYGRHDFKEENPSAQKIQRIEPSMFGNSNQIKRFGFSLSQPIDIDGNGYPDLAIGAYESGHAVILRSRSVIETNITLITYPAILQGSTESFIVSVCVTYKGEGAPASQDLSFNMTVDVKHNRTENESSKKFNAVFFREKRQCLNQTISLMKSRDFGVLDPIEISITHGINQGTNSDGIDAVLNKTSLNENEPIAVSFNKGCEDGEVCNAKLFVDASFGGVGENNVWSVGSGDISLNIVVRNENQLAYETQITIVMPPGVRLRKTIGFCTIVADPLSLACNVGNPLVKGIPKRFKIVLDMTEVETRLVNATVLTFQITKRTQSVDENGGDSTTILELNTKHLAHVTLAGVAQTEYIRYSRTTEKSKIPIRHAYQVLKLGPSLITEAYLTIDVPTSMIGRNGSFLNITDQKLVDGSGKTYECFISDPQSEDDVLLRRRREVHDDADVLKTDTFNIEGIGANLTSGRTVYLNCSTEGVSCERITCGFELSRTRGDVRNMVLDMTFDAVVFNISSEDLLTVKFHTNASVDIRSPIISDSSDSRKWSAGASTMLYTIPEPEKLPVWIIPSSISLGILLFCVLVAILSRVGFFNRSKKFEITRAEEPKLLLNVHDQEVENESEELGE